MQIIENYTGKYRKKCAHRNTHFQGCAECRTSFEGSWECSLVVHVGGTDTVYVNVLIDPRVVHAPGFGAHVEHVKRNAFVTARGIIGDILTEKIKGA